MYPVKNKNSKYNNTVNSEQEGSMANVNESNHNSVKVTQIMYVLQFYSDRISWARGIVSTYFAVHNAKIHATIFIRLLITFDTETQYAFK